MRESTCVLTASCRMPRSLEMSSESSSEVEWEDVEPLKGKLGREKRQVNQSVVVFS